MAVQALNAVQSWHKMGTHELPRDRLSFLGPAVRFFIRKVVVVLTRCGVLREDFIEKQNKICESLRVLHEMVAYNVASLIGTAIALPLLGVLAVILRFYVRLRLRPTFIGTDDWLIVLAVVLVVGQGICQIIGTQSQTPGSDEWLDYDR